MDKSIRETSRDYRHPYRPFPLPLVNRIGNGLAKIGIHQPLDSESLLRTAAQSIAQPSDVVLENTDGLKEALDVLVDSIETEANLNPVGRMITRGRLVSVLKARFRAEEQLRRQPEIRNRTLSTPLIITGLQRTGTTLLHRLIATDRRFHSLSSWEVLNPVPPSNPKENDKRIRSAKRAEKGAAWMAPDFFAVHPIDHRAPEEDVLLLDLSLKSTVAEAILRVPSYASWLENADSTEAYSFMRQLLLLLQNQDDRPFWILKTPHHLEYLDVLFKVFPEARVVQTHRDPAITTGSFLSMVAHGYGMFTDSPDPLDIGRHWRRKCRRMVECGMSYRSSLTEEEEKQRFLDIGFDELTTNPLGTLEKVYDFVGLNLDEQAAADARRFLAKNGRHRFGKHVYSLSDFGFSVDSVRQDFKEYRERYSIPNED